MLFHAFASQDERRAFGGSCFIEFQYCTLSKDAGLKKIVSVEAVRHWNNDSLYLHGDDMEEFRKLYSGIFPDAYYNNGECGAMDMWGMNYYTPENTEMIIRRLSVKKPKDHQALLEWLKKAAEYNGFYILGV